MADALLEAEGLTAFQAALSGSASPQEALATAQQTAAAATK